MKAINKWQNPNGHRATKFKCTVLARWGDETIQGQWVRAGAGYLRQLLMRDACRDSSGAASSAIRKSRYWALKKYKEMVDRLKQGGMGFASNEDLKNVHISSSCFAKM